MSLIIHIVCPSVPSSLIVQLLINILVGSRFLRYVLVNFVNLFGTTFTWPGKGAKNALSVGLYYYFKGFSFMKFSHFIPFWTSYPFSDHKNVRNTTGAQI